MRTKIFLSLSAAIAALLGQGCCDRCARTEGRAEAAVTSEPSVARALLDRSHVTPGGSAELGVMIALASGWHTYADPPGDSGMAPILTLQLPTGITAGAKRLPPFRVFKDDAGTTHGYENHLLIRVPLTVDPDAESDDIMDIGITLDYLICKESCVPRSMESTLRIPIRRDPAPVTRQWRYALEQGGWHDSQDLQQREGEKL